MTEVCNWHQDGDPDCDTWATDCGSYFCIADGTPADNNFKFCCYCGKPLLSFRYQICPACDGDGCEKCEEVGFAHVADTTAEPQDASND